MNQEKEQTQKIYYECRYDSALHAFEDCNYLGNYVNEMDFKAEVDRIMFDKILKKNDEEYEDMYQLTMVSDKVNYIIHIDKKCVNIINMIGDRRTKTSGICRWRNAPWFKRLVKAGVSVAMVATMGAMTMKGIETANEQDYNDIAEIYYNDINNMMDSRNLSYPQAVEELAKLRLGADVTDEKLIDLTGKINEYYFYVQNDYSHEQNQEQGKSY